MTRCDSAHLLRQASRALKSGVLPFSLYEMSKHIEQVRAGTATLDEFADFYMIRPKPQQEAQA